MNSVSITFITRTGNSVQVDAEIGQSLMWVAQSADLDVEGACEGNMACATCHMIIADGAYASLTPPSDEELDMLDLAQDLRPTSRLGCQIVVTEAMEGWTVTLPRETQNIMTF